MLWLRAKHRHAALGSLMALVAKHGQTLQQNTAKRYNKTRPNAATKRSQTLQKQLFFFGVYCLYSYFCNKTNQ